MPPAIIRTPAIPMPRWKEEVEASAAAASIRSPSAARRRSVSGTARGFSLALETAFARRGESGAAPSSRSRAEPKWAEITAPRIAIASSPATRETPLLTPEAMPT